VGGGVSLLYVGVVWVRGGGKECFLLTRDLKLEESVEIFGLHGWCFAFLCSWRMFGCSALGEVTNARRARQDH